MNTLNPLLYAEILRYILFPGQKKLYLHKDFKRQFFKLNQFNSIQFNMLLSDKLKELREDAKQPQRRVAAALDIDTATYCKMEKGLYIPRKEQIVAIAEFYNCDSEELIKIWLANKLYDVAKDEALARDAFNLAKDMLPYNQK